MEKINDFFCNDKIMLWAIMLNTAVMFVSGFWQDSLYFELVDVFFTLVFLCEAFAKIEKKGWHDYWKNGWNKFDFIVLLIAIPSVVSPFVEQTMTTNTILALRSMRLFKSFKLFHFIPNVEKLIKGIKHAFRASLIVFITFIVFLVVFSIFSSAIFGRISPEYFGDPAISIYSIFRVFSVEGWYEVPDNIAKNSTPFLGFIARFYFSLLMFIGGIIGLSLINSFFVDAMVEDNNNEVIEKLKKIEEKLDKLTKEI